MKKLTVLLAMAALSLMVAGSAFGLPLTVDNGEPSLQQILDANLGCGAIDAVNDQSNVGAWSLQEGASASYSIAFLKGDAGNFGLYSLITGEHVNLMIDPSEGQDSFFNINLVTGELKVWRNDGSFATVANFGNAFGFYWENTNYVWLDEEETIKNIAYTQDSKNAAGHGYGDNDNIRALRYLVPGGTSIVDPEHPDYDLELSTLYQYVTQSSGSNDWLMAFEDRPSTDPVWGDGDFNDAVFYVKDLTPVPEPGTLALLGIGLLGLGFYGRKRMKK